MTWKDKTAYEGERVIGWYVSEDNREYAAVFCPEGTPTQQNFTSEKEAKSWIENEAKKVKLP